jgi:hypothetical protein
MKQATIELVRAGEDISGIPIFAPPADAASASTHLILQRTNWYAT